MTESKQKLPERASELFPKEQAVQKILKQRARELAIPAIKKLTTKNLVEYVKFCLAENEYYGIAYSSIKEVIDNTMLTSVPNSPSYIAGIFNWRGLLLSVLNLKSFFQQQSLSTPLDKKILVVKVNHITLGILVHSIEGSNAYEPSKLELPFSSVGIEPQYLLGLHEGTTAIIDIERVLLKILGVSTVSI